MELQDRQKEAMEQAEATRAKAVKVLAAHPELKGFIPYAEWQLGQFEAYLVEDMETLKAMQRKKLMVIKKLEDGVWAIRDPDRVEKSWLEKVKRQEGTLPPN